MHTTHVWRKLYIHRAKVILLCLMLAAGVSHAQKFKWAPRNNPNYDDRKWTYGFLIGLHTTSYQIKYANNFVTEDMDTVHSVIPDWKPGFSLGFIVNYRVNDYLDIRLTPEVAFYEHTLRYNYTDGTHQDQLVETTMVEFPFLLKYKSMRRGNVRMYVVGGAKPGIEASGKKELENISDGLEVKNLNMSLEAGIGLDLYFPLFKFSPEIRFSRGVSNILDNTRNDYGKPLKYVNTNTVTIYLLFQ
ncbi:MAG TPA: porin family protein [Cyclobacteriaceae bacterium]|nr:PorT family protein [Cyclobacteriaceae bacterium]HMV09039.1 porin family protein [Cyclobacteriaceae bacterium]HMV89883.1 porin family protein [Cyclobacteriaceae bacterium]HMW99556.1 porin family protein [Cyclobacteriaceae bacterium]HMX51661.1 porin family protein [Cyclobacteriaceae bacterium]